MQLRTQVIVPSAGAARGDEPVHQDQQRREPVLVHRTVQQLERLVHGHRARLPGECTHRGHPYAYEDVTLAVLARTRLEVPPQEDGILGIAGGVDGRRELGRRLQPRHTGSVRGATAPRPGLGVRLGLALGSTSDAMHPGAWSTGPASS